MNRLTTALLSALVTVIALSSSHAQERKAGDLKIEPYVFEARGEKVNAELGRLIVPENRKKPNSRLIELAFVRFKSTAANPGPPIVYLAGGPGGSGIGAARGTRFPLFMAMREVADVIAFDQRATGMSRPSLACGESLGYPLDKPGDPQEILRLYQERARSCAQALEKKGIDLAGYNTNENADDLDDLRKALGAEKISLWGISYGTHLALATIRRHESRIHRVILAGVEGPAHTWKLPSNIQENLEKINRIAKADPNISDKVPDLIALMKRVLDRLEKQPMTVEVTDPRTRQPVGVTLGKFDLLQATASVIGNSEVAGIPALYHALSTGNTSHLLVKMIAQNAGRARQGTNGSAMPPAMDCASGADPERLRRIEREAKTTLLGGFIDFPFPGVCSGLGNLDLGPSFRAPVRSKVPALFISGTLDARTPVSNAEEVRRGFGGSVHLIIDGAVHSDPLFLSSPRIKDVMLEFMKGLPVSATRLTAAPVKFTPILKSPQDGDAGAETHVWEGVLDAGGQKLRLMLRVQKGSGGVWLAEVVSLDQGNTTLPIDTVTYEPAVMRFELRSIGASFEGEFSADKSEVSGQWKQGGRSMPLSFKRSAKGTTQRK
jgi:pimeloyl-ACP methyl ester carboxylesterase